MAKWLILPLILALGLLLIVCRQTLPIFPLFARSGATPAQRGTSLTPTEPQAMPVSQPLLTNTTVSSNAVSLFEQAAAQVNGSKGRSGVLEWDQGLFGAAVDNSLPCKIWFRNADLPPTKHPGAARYSRFTRCPGRSFTSLKGDSVTHFCTQPRQLSVAMGDGINWRAGSGVPFVKRKIPLNHEFTRLKCTLLPNTHSYGLFARVLRIPPAVSTRKPAILIVVLDAVARSMFTRMMPRTVSALQRLAGYHKAEFLRLNAQGPGTALNMPQMFGFPSRFSNSTLNLPDLLRTLGFATATAADHFKSTTIAAELRLRMDHVFGFRDTFAPQRNFLNEGKKVFNFVSSEIERHCLGGALPFRLVLRYMKSFLDGYRDRPRLGYVHLNDGHNENPWALEPFDGPFSEFLTGTIAEHRPIVALVSDHGLLYGHWSLTPTGQQERKNPVGLLLFPDELVRPDDSVRSVLQHNSQAVVTPVDLFKTFAGLPRLYGMRYSPAVDVELARQPGYDLLQQRVPFHRTCAAAQVPEWFCLCNHFVPVPIAGGVPQVLLQQFIATANAALRSVSNVCVPFTLSRIEVLETQVNIPSGEREVISARCSTSGECSRSSGSGLPEVPCTISVLINTTDIPAGTPRFVFAALFSGGKLLAAERRTSYTGQKTCGAAPLAEPYCLCR